MPANGEVLFYLLRYYNSVQKYFKIILFFWFISQRTLAQTPVVLIVNDAATNVSLLKTKQVDSTEAVRTAEKLWREIIAKGHITANLQLKQHRADTMYYLLDKGDLYKWVKLHQGNTDEDILSNSGYREKFFTGTSFKPEELSRLFERILRYCENNGYPFAEVSLDSIQLSKNSIEAHLRVSKNQQIYIDSIEISGNTAIKRNYLYNFSSIKPGSPYNEGLIRVLDRKVNQLAFARTTRPLKVYFTGNKARIITFIDQKKASQVDGVLGLAPQSAINNKLMLTGELNLNLQNLFGSGKTFELHYRSFLARSQDLKARITYPYILNSSVGLDYTFALLKFDSLYLQVDHDIGIQYLLSGNDYIKFFYEIQNYSLLSIDTIAIKNNKRLPEFSDMRNNLYGIGIRLNTLDYFANPRKGMYIEANAGAGVKKIVRNSTINSLEINDASSGTYNLYDSIKLRSIQYRFQANIQKFWPLSGKKTLLTQIMSASLQAEQIFTNELFRIGGIRTLKGFDEQSVFCTSYAILNMEYRYLLNNNSNFILLFNGAWHERNARGTYSSDMPWGVGTGINFQTGAGVFSFYYALGKQQNNRLELRQAKIHFGIVNYF